MFITSRRNFLGQLSCAAIGSNTLLNTIVNLNLANTVVAKRALFNNDYKASAYFSAYYKHLAYRIRLFHISSHLGDDYMIRNEDFSTNDKSVNYHLSNLSIINLY